MRVVNSGSFCGRRSMSAFGSLLPVCIRGSDEMHPTLPLNSMIKA